jgi:hypothetical protein
VGKNLKLGLAAVAVIACGALAAPQALAVSSYESHIGISDHFPAFHGDVDSESGTCVPSRIVRLYRVKNGDDKLLGQDQTDATGEWAITEPGDFTLKSGVYYAKVNASLNGLGDRCQKDKSRKIPVD